jgi:aryl-alcohol dehydrogenase-like predicted oxidoreductase
MNRRRLGRTGIQVSEISLGTVEIGLDYGIPVAGEERLPSRTAAERLLNSALDLGCNLIDTARAYGASEEIIGHALKSRRHEYTLATKVLHFEEIGLSSAALRQAVERSVGESLRALQTDVADIVHVHSATVEVIRRGELAAVLQDLQQQGYIRFIGATTYSEAASVAALEDGRFDCLQIAYNLLDRRPEDVVFALARQHDVGLIVRSVLLKGALTHRYTYLPAELAELKAAVTSLNTLLGTAEMSLPELAYRYVLAHPDVNTALVGTSRLEELEASLAYTRRGPVPDDMLRSIQQVVVRDHAQLDPSTWPTLEPAEP